MTDPSPRTDVAAAVQTPAARPTVFLHVGTMKTGTSYLQRILQRNADLLEEDGVKFPLDHDRWAMQVRAARDILNIRGRPTDGAWAAMVDVIHQWDGRAAVVSMEFLSLASPARVRRIVASLAPSPVEVVVTVRDLVRVLPSAWQSMIKQGDPWSFDEFVASVMSDGDVVPEVHRRFWRHHDLPAITAKWGAEVGIENVHVVTVPPDDAEPSVLWERFSALIGVPPERYDVNQDRGSNPSLGVHDTELMRQVSAELREHLSRAAFKRWATDYFANRVLRPIPDERAATERPQLDAAAYGWAVRRSEEMVEGLRRQGVSVVGDLDDLIPPAHPPAIDDRVRRTEPYPEATAHIVAALLRRIAEVDPQLAARDGSDDDEFQDPDDAADADEAAEAAEGDEAAETAAGAAEATAAEEDTSDDDGSAEESYVQTDTYDESDAYDQADTYDEGDAYDQGDTARAG